MKIQTIGAIFEGENTYRWLLLAGGNAAFSTILAVSNATFDRDWKAIEAAMDYVRQQGQDPTCDVDVDYGYTVHGLRNYDPRGLAAYQSAPRF